MASQKRARAASASRPGPADSKPVTAQAGGGQAGRAVREDASRAQSRRGDRGPGGRAQGGSGRGQTGRGQDNRRNNRRSAAAQARSGTAAAEPLRAESAPRPAPPRWFQLTTLGLSLAALGVSIYLTTVHYTSPRLLACSANGTINCEKVISSTQSMVFGVFPVAVLGMAFYVFMVAINTPWAWRSPLPLLWWARLGGITTGIGFVLYLLYAELIQIGNICLWCTGVHVITFLLFVLLIFYATLGTGATARNAR